ALAHGCNGLGHGLIRCGGVKDIALDPQDFTDFQHGNPPVAFFCFPARRPDIDPDYMEMYLKSTVMQSHSAGVCALQVTHRVPAMPAISAVSGGGGRCAQR